MKNKKKAILMSILVSAGLLACGKINDSIDNKDEIVDEHAVIEVVDSNGTSLEELNCRVEEIENKEMDFEYIEEYGYIKENTSLFDLNGDVIGSVEKGNKIYVIATNNVISVIELQDGTRGFINNNKYSYSYVESESITNEYTYGYAIYDDGAKVYDTYGVEIGKIEQYEPVKIIDSNDTQSFVETRNGIKGLMYNSMINKLPDDFIDVDISDQLVTVYNDNEKVLEADVVTGVPGHDTDLGYQEILGKDYDRYLDGPTWHVHVDYFFYFNYGEGFHDASWRNEFGGNIYKTGGSHGCVNMEHPDVEKMDEVIEVGTKVLVHK